MANQIGRAVVFGIDGGFQYSGVAVAIDVNSNELTRVSFEDQANKHESKDRRGETIGLVFWNSRAKITLNFYPCATAGVGALDLARVNVVLPDVGSLVEIEDMPGQLINGNWIYEGGGTIEMTNEAEVKMVLPLMKYSTDISTPST